MRVVHTGRRRWRGRWLHWCLFDRQCRSDGCPKDIYVHPLGWILRFREEVICPDCGVHFKDGTHQDHECPPF